MKRLIRHTVIFLAPVLIILLIIPVNERLKFSGLKNDCFNHGIWIYDRIQGNPEPFDIVFLGTSHTINGINDRVISGIMQPLNAVNFGYCRLGRNLDYVLLKEILEKRDIKKLVLEVRESEDRYSHPVFPLIASGRDVYFPVILFNRDIFKDIWHHVSYKVELYQDLFFQTDSMPPIRMEEYGYAGHPDTASSTFLDEIKQKRNQPKKDANAIENEFYNHYPESYLKKISRICHKKGIGLYFLYLPSYGNNYNEPSEMKLYRELGTVLIPPSSLFEDKNNWHDENHLNDPGARKLSEWVAGNLTQ